MYLQGTWVHDIKQRPDFPYSKNTATFGGSLMAHFLAIFYFCLCFLIICGERPIFPNSRSIPLRNSRLSLIQMSQRRRSRPASVQFATIWAIDAEKNSTYNGYFTCKGTTRTQGSNADWGEQIFLLRESLLTKGLCAKHDPSFLVNKSAQQFLRSSV